MKRETLPVLTASSIASPYAGDPTAMGLAPLSSLRQNMQELLGTLFGREAAITPWASYKPQCDIYLEDDQLALEFDLPGITRDEVTVHVSQDLVTIFGERQPVREERLENLVSRERAPGSFHRVVRLPYQVRTENIEACLKNGVLRLILPLQDAVRARGVRVAIK